MFRLIFLTFFLLLASQAQADRPPNIVLLIGDDHGYPYFGFAGDEVVETPAMDTLARGGVVFSQGQVTVPYCRPSLRTMITGLHPVQYQLALNERIEQRKKKTRNTQSSGRKKSACGCRWKRPMACAFLTPCQSCCGKKATSAGRAANGGRTLTPTVTSTKA
ncbi:MAG: sulfatase-like hydrolase/transferase [Pseudomonadota bacterium]